MVHTIDFSMVASRARASMGETTVKLSCARVAPLQAVQEESL